MKKKIVMLCFTLVFTYMCGLTFDINAAAVSASGATTVASVTITAEAGIVADAATGRIYYNKGMHTKMYPASITKIMTGILAAEKGKDTDRITISGEVTKAITSDTQNIGLTVGEKITQQEALYTMFLRSANDSANALAVHTGGTIGNFVLMMNKRAKELGCTGTHFSNANGLPDINNVTTAYDMALITKEAVKEPKVMKYFGAVSYTMPATNKHKSVTYGTLHKMMYNSYYKYNGVIAGKTGWETMSGHTLVSVARRNGHTLICVVMKDPSSYSTYSDTIALLNYGFSVASNSTSADSSAEYLKSPVKAVKTPVKANKPVTIKKAAVKKAKKSVEATSGIGGGLTAPLLLLACSIYIFAFLATCRHRSAKRFHKNVRKNVGNRVRSSVHSHSSDI